MDGRAFLESARQLLAAPSEANWRSAAGRCYVALLNEARAALERWGFPLPVGAAVHAFVVPHFTSTAIMDLLRIEVALDRLERLAREADHALSSPGLFADAREVTSQFVLVPLLIDLLDQIEGDPNRRTAAIADVRARHP
jgi:hypothetical protein